VSKARCVQSLGGDFAAFAAFAAVFSTILISTNASAVAAFPAVPASVFASAG
jgi:hypothetical protein